MNKCKINQNLGHLQVDKTIIRIHGQEALTLFFPVLLIDSISSLLYKRSPQRNYIKQSPK